MELNHLLQLISELPKGITLDYVRGTDSCRFIDVDVDNQRVNAETSKGESKSWAPTFFADLAPKIYENEPFNLSSLLNNKGSMRPVIETIIAHTKEFYSVRKDNAVALVWIPSKPKSALELTEIQLEDIPAPTRKPEATVTTLSPEELEAKVREAFMQYWEIIDQHGADIKSFTTHFAEDVNPYVAQLGIGYTSIFQIVDADQFNAVIDAMASRFPETAYIKNGRQNHSRKYEVGSTYLHYKNFLHILAISDFRGNLDNQVKNRLKTATLTDTTSPDYLRAMRTKPFLLLAGISGTGKSRIVKQMAFDSCPDNAVLRQDLTSPGNYCLVEVKPNWHDSTELLGYVSRIGSAHYVLTPFVKFLAKAMLHPEVPFFVCLDEMNLAPVEQYFAEFLSVLESRTKVDGHIVSEPLIKAERFGKLITEAALFDREEAMPTDYNGTTTEDQAASYGKEHSVFETLQREGLRIPENVVIVGTVNMDETTHQFSRKVIDRAMTIEMNLPEGEPFKDFFENPADLEYRETPASKDLYLATETKAKDVVAQLAEIDSGKTGWLKDEVAKFLTELNAALNGTPFKVAYRVQNELMLYFYQLWRENPNAEADWSKILNTSCDQILMMKVLPRIEGDEELLGKVLNSENGTLSNFIQPYANSAKKVAEMWGRLDSSRFTSFWP